MTTGDLDRPLREAFRFDAADLAANRAGRLSPRQDALLRAGRRGMQLSLAVFAAVMVGSVGLVAFFNRRLETSGRLRAASAVAAGVALVVDRRGLPPEPPLSLGGPLPAAQRGAGAGRDRLGCPRRLPGPVRRGRRCGCPERTPSPAFQPGVEYRVYYLAGPVALVLSAESLSRGTTSREPAADADADAAEHAAASAQIGIVRRGYVIVVLIGLLALGIPVAGVLVRDLPPRLRPLAWIGLLGRRESGSSGSPSPGSTPGKRRRS